MQVSSRIDAKEPSVLPAYRLNAKQRRLRDLLRVHLAMMDTTTLRKLPFYGAIFIDSGVDDDELNAGHIRIQLLDGRIDGHGTVGLDLPETPDFFGGFRYALMDLHPNGDGLWEVCAEHSPQLVEFFLMPLDELIEFLAAYAAQIDR